MRAKQVRANTDRNTPNSTNARVKQARRQAPSPRSTSGLTIRRVAMSALNSAPYNPRVALRRCVHDLRIDAANTSAVIHLRTLPVLASGPAFQHTEPITTSTAK